MFKPLHLLHSQEIRGYALLVFLSLLALIFAERTAREKTGPNLLGAFVFCGLLFNTHYLGIVFVFCLCAYLWFLDRWGGQRYLSLRNLVPAAVILLIFIWKIFPVIFNVFLPRAGLYGEGKAWWLTRALG